MSHTSTKKLLIHVDVDSPLKLLNFYKIKGITFTEKEMERFYQTSWERALAFFDQYNLKATFFVVGDELESNSSIQNVILKAHQAGHEIENHTYSHPFGLASLPVENIRSEVIRCNEIVERITGQTPVGFRSPGYSVNTALLNVLDELNFSYDSSGFWSIMNPALKLSQRILFKNGLSNAEFGGVDSSLPESPYFPSKENWLSKSATRRGLLEIPLPRTNFFRLPFYNNFNLWAPFTYSNLVSKTLRKQNVVYLFHIIEFMDLTDGVPKELAVHPNLKVATQLKVKNSGKLISNLMQQYEPMKTRDFVSVAKSNIK